MSLESQPLKSKACDNKALKRPLHFIQKQSVNFNERPSGTTIDMVVIHYTDMFTVEESLDILTSSTSHVSAHFLIDTDGTIFQLVDTHMRAWHAGISQWQGVENVNHRSIGIELQNAGQKYFEKFKTYEPYPLLQMQALVDLIHHLKEEHPIAKSLILGHSDVAPDRKIDPGPHFDWQWLRNRIKFN